MLEVITNPNEILRRKSAEINIEEIYTPKFKKLISEMTETMLEKDGAGLAALKSEKISELL